MKKLTVILLLVLSTVFAVDYDTTNTYLFQINIQQSGSIQHYTTIGGKSPSVEKQLSLVFAQILNDGIDADSVFTWYNILEFVTADGVFDTAYTIISDVDNMNPTFDTLGVQWFDNDTWQTLLDGLSPYYPVQ